MFSSIRHCLILAQLSGALLNGVMPHDKGGPPASQPTSQPTVQVVVLKSDLASTTQPASVGELLQRNRFLMAAEGKQTITLQEMTQPGFWVDQIRDLVKAAVFFIPSLLGALFFLLMFWFIHRAVRKLLMGAMKRANVDTSIRDMLAALVKWTIMGFGIVIACNQIGIPIVAMLTGVSILGLAVGFAAQETLANFIAGVVIFWDKPFKVGDWLTVDGTFGQVQRITFRSSRLLNLSGETIIFPNTHMLANKVANHTTHPLSRISIPIGIAYGASIDAARSALLQTVEGDSRIQKTPAAEVVVDKCAESSVDLLLRFWIVDESLEQRMHFEYMEKAKKALDTAGIEIPFPHMQLLVKPTPAIDALAGKPVKPAT